MPQQITRASANYPGRLWSRRSQNHHRALVNQFAPHIYDTVPGSRGSTSIQGRPKRGQRGRWEWGLRRELKTLSRPCHSVKGQSRDSSLSSSTEKSRQPCCDFRISRHMCHSWSREDTHIPLYLWAEGCHQQSLYVLPRSPHQWAGPQSHRPVFLSSSDLPNHPWQCQTQTSHFGTQVLVCTSPLSDDTCIFGQCSPPGRRPRNNLSSHT